MAGIARIDDEIIDTDYFIRTLKPTGQFEGLVEQPVREKLAVHAVGKQGLPLAPQEIRGASMRWARRARTAAGSHRSPRAPSSPKHPKAGPASTQATNSLCHMRGSSFVLPSTEFDLRSE
ncbi:hypothetical protein ACFPOU_21625 [Massilia jejuensis]|uniref:Uncharacterized protein n=1 Tax=Massilia jejuensis TaxID=648894 RepID=A0ABW0PM32_9BURK